MILPLGIVLYFIIIYVLDDIRSDFKKGHDTSVCWCGFQASSEWALTLDTDVRAARKLVFAESERRFDRHRASHEWPEFIQIKRDMLGEFA